MSEPDLKQAVENERNEVLHQLEDWLELPVIVLGFVWLVLLVVDLVWGLNPFLNAAVWIIWGIFVLDFLVRFILAPHKPTYLKKNWLTALSLFVPALRFLRVLRAVRLVRLLNTFRQLRLLRVISSLNRGMRNLRAATRRRRFGYIFTLTAIMTLVSAAAMYAFENQEPGGFENFGDALYWTAMMMTTLGSAYWPQSIEGRVMAFLLALYAFTMFGYVTATLATYFIGRDAEDQEAELAGAKSVEALRMEIEALRQEIREFNAKSAGISPDEETSLRIDR